MNSTMQLPAEPTLPDSTEINERTLWAPWWHTLLLIGFIFATSHSAATSVTSGAATKIGKTYQYVETIVMQWLVVLYIWWGLRLRKRTLWEAIGKTWKSIEDAMLDLAIAAAFWLLSATTLIFLQKLMGMANNKAVQQRMHSMEFLAPHSGRELALFLLLAVTAGICEEIMFRGYLQRQFIAMTRNGAAGIVLSAALFGFAHQYQGVKSMVVLGCYGAMFGVLAYFRRSIIPGMIAHAGQDSLVGFVLFFAKYLPIPQ